MKKILVTLFILSCPAIRAQINIQGSVYGGARQANVTGSTNVTIGGEATAHDIVINRVYGGNDISGSIGEDGAKVETKATGEKGLFIGQLYGGGNGDYDYTEDGTDAEGNVTYTVKETASATEPLATGARKPDIAKVELKLKGGTFGYVFGGGNAVTVTGTTDITIDNATTPMTRNSVLTLPESINLTKLSDELAEPVNQRLMDMGINITTFRRGYNFLRVFGGNNKAAMRIRPTWHLEKGSIINLYSGGNEGDMTSPVGLLLEIADNSNITVENVYGGCRKADVHPLNDSGGEVTSANIQLTDTDENGNLKYKFPAGLSARVLVRGGNITNVYGGNDISGKVTGGNAVGIYHSISGDVYGGGNGSYAYTDKSEFANDILWGDFYYDPGTSSVEALNNHRPNAEQVSLRVKGTDAEHPTVIGGSIYVGGNSATLKPSSSISNPMVHLKIGSHVIADNVFLGNNGENMVDSKAGGVLWQYKQSLKPQEGRGEGATAVRFSSLDLTNADIFKKYMDGCAMNMLPAVVFDNTGNGDPENYVSYSSSFGSLFCGGNVGSMTYPGVNNLDFSAKIIIFDKVVGGCNNAFVPAVTGLNAAYEGGILGSSEEQASYVDDSGKTKDRLLLNFRGAKLVPKRWKMKTVEGKETYDLDANGNRQLEWNTVKWVPKDDDAPTLAKIKPTDDDIKNRRLAGGNVYGGCYNSGRVNGNVVININSALTDEADVFGEGKSGVNKENQYNDVLASALNVFGGGYGADSEISGNTTINIDGRDAYAFQTYGGGEMGKVTGNCTTNLLNNGRVEYIYGGGMEGDVTGNTITHLGDGTCVGVIGGACNADIGGHTEVYIGDLGFPTITEDVYGGNDFGGRININGEADFSDRVSELAESKVYNNMLLRASTYVEYVQGNVTENIFGGSYGNYNYKDKLYRKYTNPDGTVKSGFSKPHLKSAFLNFRPNNNGSSSVARVYGGSEGYSGEANNNKMQDRSYVLVDFQANNDNFAAMPVFGAGDYAGIGFGVDKATADANEDGVTAATIVDLVQGQVGNVYGGSYKEGATRRTIVNVPAGSTIKVNSLFGGAYGLDNAVACDAYEATVNYSSEQALVSGAVFGGNNHARRTLYGTVNVNAPVWTDRSNGYYATVYGAGLGKDSWSRNTTVNLNDKAKVYEVYGGGNAGKVLNQVTEQKWNNELATDNDDKTNLYIGLDGGYTDDDLKTLYAKENPLGTKTNTNVYINKGATVGNYCYGGGLGKDAVVSGTTYIGLHGGTVVKDLYGGGTSGSVEDWKGLKTFTAGTNAYVEGGTLRNVYGGGWAGSVGHHEGDIDARTTNDIDGTTNVVIGIRKDQASLPADYGFYKGVPAVQRNAYAGGEGGAVFGTANITLNNGYVGYVYNATGTDDAATEIDERYEEKLHDETWTDHVGLNRLEGSGNVFGGGYIDNSSVDFTNVKMMGGWVRNSLFGGGEIAAIGRGKVTVGGYKNSERTYQGTYKQGKTHVEMYNGHVLRDVFGGGKGYDNLGNVGTLYTDGYVFGQTEVYIRGGEVGTETNYVNGYGNVFGGGDIGYVYGIGTADTKGEKPSPNHYYYKDSDGKWTEDCKVVVEAYAQVKDEDGVTIDGTEYAQYDYVPTDKLNKLKGRNQDDAWNALDDKGIVIRNAVFGGGNVDEGSDKIYANTVTVFGNVTATLRDVYRRDLITIGTEHVGGLYGGGNLSLVNGYRELHVSNYGTDYYGLQQQIDMDTYENQLTDRERAYFRLRYTCLTEFPDGKDALGISYKGHKVGDQIWEDEYKDLPESLKSVRPDGTTGEGYYWSLDGVCSIYAGRLLNTLQRADLAGIYGSRMVLQGARDRVTDVADYTRYTINRVGELSLMKMDSPAGEEDDTNKTHGNYFGIYSLVNYLGNMTSDVLMDDVRKSDTNDTDDTTSYWKWKHDNHNSRKRNTATSRNQVALASGVFLELITENSTPEHKDYGYITGVVELDLINAKADAVGGGYVYAKNEHGKRSPVTYTNVTLSPYNATTRTYKMYTYSEATNNLEGIQTSGNFVHGQKKTIIDDCYPHNLEYTPGTGNYSEAHYWYIKGSIYIYDQVLSAYTGSPTAYTRERHIPLTISAGSHGQLKLVNVQPNLYAYYDTDGTSQIGPDGIKVNNNSVTYKLNDVITYWDWSQLSADEQKHFVKETMVTVAPCTYTTTSGGSGTYAEGVVMLPSEYETLRRSLPKKTIDGVANVPYVHDEERDEDVAADRVFRPSNNLSHNTGYVISFEMDTPPDWDKWYSPKSGSGAISTATYNGKTYSEKDGYIPGPTFTTSVGGVYGQRHYTEDEIIPNEVVSKYHDPNDGKQAVVSRAYVTKEQVTYTYGGTTKSVNPGTAISKTEYDALDAVTKAKFKEAYVCTNTLKFNDENYIIYGDLVNDDMIDELATAFGKTKTEIKTYLSQAYICEQAGMYGGKSYASGTNYDALDGWASLTSSDRAQNKFTFNYDAFDILADPNYTGDMTKYHAPYSDVKPVEYVAIYHGDTPLTYSGGTLNKGGQLTREQYEQLPNEKYHYTPIHVPTTATDGDDYYIAKKAFSRGNVPYAKGQVITPGTYRALTDQERSDWVEVLHFTNLKTNEEDTYFYCREDYTGTTSVTNRNNNGTVLSTTVNGSGASVQAGWVITKEDYSNLRNDQHDFTIKGNEPTEKTTLYVSRESDINDLTSEKIISVIYQYTYNEGSDDGDNVELVNELHIVNIHLQFESGAPIVDPLQAPGVVLPGSTVGLKQPNVTPGAYELLGGGWEIFDNYTDAHHHRNGNEYSNNRTPMYWYQNQKYYVAYYAKSYLGKTYSNPVPFSVANYHDIADVMADKEHHMYVDYDPEKLIRQSKIYINDYSNLPADDPRSGKNGLTELKNFIDLSHGHGPTGHAALKSNAKGGEHLDFILRADLRPSGSWTAIANGENECFSGTFHGDGYTISGLDHSLFDKLCGDVYNLGVTGSFTEAGIANSGDGYIENSWVKTTGTPASGVKAVFGNPTRGSGYQVVNCYYPESNAFTSGAATKMPDKAFYNGTVAYQLNGFYLNKRYYDGKGQSSGDGYNYLRAAADGTLPTAEDAATAYTTGRYPASPYPQYGYIGYVEDRYNNEDFIYAGGSIPESFDVRQRSRDHDGITEYIYAPIWPDDYLFFGQTLTYGYDTQHPHNDLPTQIAKANGRLVRDQGSNHGNRVYRAPAYFGDKNMSVAHFNPSAVFAKKSSDNQVKAYEGMTAIDFTGSNGDVAGGYNLGSQTGGFYPPLLDDDGLSSFRNIDLTRNLLVYTHTDGDAARKTNTAVGNALTEPVFGYVDPTYLNVAKQDTTQIHGHWIENGMAKRSHLLVDKNDFNAPMGYRFDTGYRMWYQRTPDRYVEKADATTKGWEDVSLPFKAELVTTHQKGEITHFYQGSTLGHEYWLRELTKITQGTPEEAVGNFTYPKATGSGTRTVGNTFLWDWYYKRNNYDDANADDYQSNYYSSSRDYPKYPLSAAATPYLIGFPGQNYYEFDLSGEFLPAHTAVLASNYRLEQQVITFASAEGALIDVSDTELVSGKVNYSGYDYCPNYKNQSVEADDYLLSADGAKYERQDAQNATKHLLPFRPYFVTKSSGTRSGTSARYIIFSNEVSEMKHNTTAINDIGTDGDLIVKGAKKKIEVESQLDYTTDVRIVTPAGITVTSYSIQPTEVVETRVETAGVYIVYADKGKYVKKVIVK